MTKGTPGCGETIKAPSACITRPDCSALRLTIRGVAATGRVKLQAPSAPAVVPQDWPSGEDMRTMASGAATPDTANCPGAAQFAPVTRGTSEAPKAFAPDAWSSSPAPPRPHPESGARPIRLQSRRVANLRRRILFLVRRSGQKQRQKPSPTSQTSFRCLSAENKICFQKWRPMGWRLRAALRLRPLRF